MRILDEDSNKSLKNLQILLTRDEVNELIDSLQAILRKGVSQSHSHINDKEYQHEITVAIYDEGNLQNNCFHSRIVELIQNDL